MTPIADATGLFPPRLLAWLALRGCIGIGWQPPPERLPRRAATTPTVLVFEPGGAAGRLRPHLCFQPGGTLSAAESAQVSAYLAALFPLLGAVDPAPLPSVSLAQDALVALEHRLRNHLNSLLMNAGVLALSCDSGPDLDPYVEQMQADAQSCLAVLGLLTGSEA